MIIIPTNSEKHVLLDIAKTASCCHRTLLSTQKSILELKGLEMTHKLGLDIFSGRGGFSVLENLGVDTTIVSIWALEVE